MRKNEKPEKLLLKKIDQIHTGAELLMNHTTDYQDMKRYVSKRVNDIEFTNEQQSKIERCNFILNQILVGQYTKTQVICMVQKIYKIKKIQAYSDFNSTQLIYLSVLNFNKLFEIQIELESAKKLQKECLKKDDIETAVLFQHNIISLLKMLPGEREQPHKDFEGQTIEATFDPGLLGTPEIDMKEVLALINAKRKVKIKADLYDKPYTTASYSGYNGI